jgi:hypothetical protein
MAFTQQPDFQFKHVNQPDNLSSIMSADQIKTSFDSQAQELRTTLNKLITDLGSSIGAINIGLSPISGLTGTDIQTVLGSINTKFASYLPLTGGTVSGILQSSNSIRADSNVAGQTTLVLKNSVDDSYLRFFTTAGNNYLASSNYASTISKNLLITGYSGNNMAKLTVMADNFTAVGTSTFNNAMTISYGSGQGAQLFINQSSNNSQIKMTADLPECSIASGTIDGTGSRSMRICDTFGTNIPTLFINANLTTLTGDLSLTGQVTINNNTGFYMKSTANDGQIRFTTTGAVNWLQSGTMASAAKNFTLSGMNGTTMSNVDILATQMKVNGSIVSTGVQNGSVTITPVANTPTSAHVTFSPAYANAPTVICTAVSGVPGTQVTGFSVSNITTTGCDIYVTRTNTNATTINWVAFPT